MACSESRTRTSKDCGGAVADDFEQLGGDGLVQLVERADEAVVGVFGFWLWRVRA